MSLFYIFVPFSLSIQGAFEYVHVKASLAMLCGLHMGRWARGGGAGSEFRCRNLLRLGDLYFKELYSDYLPEL